MIPPSRSDLKMSVTDQVPVVDVVFVIVGHRCYRLVIAVDDGDLGDALVVWLKYLLSLRYLHRYLPSCSHLMAISVNPVLPSVPSVTAIHLIGELAVRCYRHSYNSSNFIIIVSQEFVRMCVQGFPA